MNEENPTPDTPTEQPPAIDESLHKTLHHKRRLSKKLLLFVIAAIILLSGAIIAIVYLLPTGPTLKSGDIKIGDRTVTRQQIADYSEKVKQYLKANPDVSFKENVDDPSRTPEEVATDDIIMNAILKYWAAQYSITVSSMDIAVAAHLDPTSEQEASTMVADQIGEDGSIGKTRIENLAYKTKLQDKLIASRTILKVSASFITPYFQNLPDSQVSAEYARAKNRLQNEVLPLFKQKLSKEKIAEKADVNTLDSDTSDDQNNVQYEKGIVTTASFKERLKGDEFHDIVPSKAYPYVRITTEQPESLNEKIKSLKNVGDYTDVFMEQTGAYSIIRLESKSDGTYSSWTDLLREYKEKYAYATPNPVVAVLQAWSKQIVASILSIANITTGTEQAGAISRPASCAAGDHNLCYWVGSVNTANDTLIGGTGFYFHNRSGCDGCTSSGNYVTPAGGWTQLQYNCNGQAAIFTNSGNPGENNAHQDPSSHPAGYVYTGAEFPNWIPSEMNAIGNAYVIYYYKPAWKVTATDPGSKIRADNGTYTANALTLIPGQAVQFQHSVKITDGASNSSIRGTTTNTVSGKNSTNPVIAGLTNVLLISGSAPAGTTGSQETVKAIITQDYVSDTKVYCQYLTATPGGGAGGSSKSNSVCFTVPYNYHPPNTCNDPNANCGNPPDCDSETCKVVFVCPIADCPTKTRDMYWQLTGFIVPPSGDVPNGGENKKTPEAQYGNGATKIQGGTQSFDPGTTNIPITEPVIDIYADYQPGTKVCYGFSFNPATSDTSNWRHSTPFCITITKTPKVQVRGGDLTVGRPFNALAGTATAANVTTGTTIKTISAKRTIFGSWVEYGIFASGIVTGAGSGSAFASTGIVNATSCTYSKLTFVNATSSQPSSNCTDSGAIGGYGTGRTIPDIAANFPVVPTKTPVFNDADTNAQGIYTSNDHGKPVVYDPITISAKTIAKGQWIVINAPNADVTITGDIKYTTSPLGSIYDVPQMVIIAKNIYINANVQQIDAWLVAQGTSESGTGLLDTCRISNTFATPLDITTCDKKLQVNGPVMAQKLWLRRTAGSGTASASDDPAEVFNLRPDAYLWMFARASGTGHVQTTYSQELPPRL